MTIAGWIVMIASVGSVVALTIYCSVKLLTLPAQEVAEHLKVPLTIDTHDLDAD